jgi:lipid A 3-O-deacylase
MIPFRSLPRAAALALSCMSLALASPAAAQQVRALQLTSDNDAYDFWIPMAARPDYEYSNGLRVAAELDGSGGWTRLAAALAPCAAEGTAGDGEAGCASTTVEAGQRLYSPRMDTPEPVSGQRPFAGWLYAAVTGRVVDGATRHTLAVEAGVTGKPSLGEPVMEGYHRIAGFWEPMGWKHQLAFEPAAAVRYGVERRVAEARVGGVRAGELTMGAGASAGTLRTAAHAGAELRAGTRLAHPWAARPLRGTSVYVLAAARGEAVAHDLFLDGNTFRDTPARVTRQPYVASSRWGVGVARGGLSMEYRVTARTRAYDEEPGGHPYSTIEITWRRAPPCCGRAAKPAAPFGVQGSIPSEPIEHQPEP